MLEVNIRSRKLVFSRESEITEPSGELRGGTAERLLKFELNALNLKLGLLTSFF